MIFPWREFREAGVRGFLLGAILYGVPLSFLHVLGNEGVSAGGAVATLVAFVAIYGSGSGAATLGAAVVLSLARVGTARATLLGFGAFNVLFWSVGLTYGLTYDEVPRAAADSLGSMIAYLAARAGAVAILAAVVSCLVARVRVTWVRAAAVLAAAVAAHAGVGLARGESRAVAATRPDFRVRDTGVDVIAIGIDGADFRILDPLLAKGLLPNVAALEERGAFGPLATLPDSNSAVIWASIYTGNTPERHGVHDFFSVILPGVRSPGLFPVHRTYFKEIAGALEPLGLARRRTLDRSSLAAPPIWEIVDGAGLASGVVDGYFFSYPAPEPRTKDGFVLSYGIDGFVEKARGTAAFRKIGDYARPVEVFADVEEALDGPDFAWQTEALLKLLATRPRPRFSNLYAHEPDAVLHRYFRYHEPKYFPFVDAEGIEKHGSKIVDFHLALDAFLGRLEAAIDENTVIAVLSDHGHSPTIVHAMDTQHRHGPPGVLFLAGGPIRTGGVVLEGAHVYDVFPTILHLLGLPVPEDVTGRVLTEAIEPSFLARFPVERVASLDALGAPVGAAHRSAESEAEELEKLRALGYIR